MKINNDKDQRFIKKQMLIIFNEGIYLGFQNEVEYEKPFNLNPFFHLLIEEFADGFHCIISFFESSFS